MNEVNGVIILDKPAGITSAAAVNRVKRLLPRGTKIGHAGTLDPFATGVLLLLVGKATKSCETLMDQPKQYETTIKLGAVTATDDLESPEQPFAGGTACQAVLENPHGLAARAREILRKFIAPFKQVRPPNAAMRIAAAARMTLPVAGMTSSSKRAP